MGGLISLILRYFNFDKVPNFVDSPKVNGLIQIKQSVKTTLSTVTGFRT